MESRTEVQALISALEAVHGETEYKEVLSTYLAYNLLFRKKVTGTASGSGSQIVDFTDIDYIEFTASSAVNISFSGIETGEEKILKVVKTAGTTISFPDDEDQTPDTAAIASLTYVYYRVYRVDTSGTIVVQPISQCILQATDTIKGIAETATATEVTEGTSAEKMVTPLRMSQGFGVKVFSAYIENDGTIYNRPTTINSFVDSIDMDGDDFVLTLNESMDEQSFHENYMMFILPRTAAVRIPTYTWESQDTVNDTTTAKIRLRNGSGNVDVCQFQLEIMKYS